VDLRHPSTLGALIACDYSPACRGPPSAPLVSPLQNDERAHIASTLILRSLMWTTLLNGWVLFKTFGTAPFENTPVTPPSLSSVAAPLPLYEDMSTGLVVVDDNR
jgi:hypothetical protein